MRSFSVLSLLFLVSTVLCTWLNACSADAPSLEKARLAMVRWQIQDRGIKNPRVLDVMKKVERHRFVPAPLEAYAYSDQPLPIGEEQTISQPYIVALMTELLDPQPTDVVLEIGTGSGYQAAVLAELVHEVYTIEIVEKLGKRAQALLETLGYKNIHTLIGDGYKGWPERAPFDKIIITAAPPEIPKALVAQLKIGGKMVVPVGTHTQTLMVLTKTPEGVEEVKNIPVRFVPMVKSGG